MNSQEPSQERISSSEEIAQLRDRIKILEEYAHSNRKRIRNSKALNALLVVLFPLFLLTGELHFGKEWGGNVKSRDFEISDLTPLIGIGLGALGVVGSDEIGKLMKK